MTASQKPAWNRERREYFIRWYGVRGTIFSKFLLAFIYGKGLERSMRNDLELRIIICKLRIWKRVPALEWHESAWPGGAQPRHYLLNTAKNFYHIVMILLVAKLKK